MLTRSAEESATAHAGTEKIPFASWAWESDLERIRKGAGLPAQASMRTSTIAKHRGRCQQPSCLNSYQAPAKPRSEVYAEDELS